MRILAILPLLAIAGCGEGEEKAKARTRAQATTAGQWETSSRVTSVRKMDEGEPRIDTPVGTEASGGSCVAAGEVSRPPIALFVGPDYDCEYGNFYMRNGRINASLQCTRDGLDGRISGTVDGTYGEGEFDTEVEIATALNSDGDVTIRSQVTGRRTGECQAEPAEGGNQASTK